MNLEKLKIQLQNVDSCYDNYSVVFRNDNKSGLMSDVDYFLIDDEKKQINLCQEWF